MITIYADGSALGTPGPGGWAFLVENADGTRVSRCGAVADSTNNQMELLAAINALAFVNTLAEGVIHCDSQYVVKGVNEWRKGWERKGMRRADGKPVLNAALWKDLYAQVDAHPKIRFEWVKGHADSQGNNDVDLLARGAAEMLRDNPKAVRRIDAPLTVESFKPIEPVIEKAIDRLQADIAKLTSLAKMADSRGWEAAKEVFQEDAGSWVIRYNMALGAPPIDFLLKSEDDAVVRLLGQIQHGVYA